MPQKIGDTVYVERWESTKGFSIGEYEVVSHEHGRLGLRESKFHYLSKGKIVTLDGDWTKTLAVNENFFDTPLEDRLEALKSDIDLMMSHFT